MLNNNSNKINTDVIPKIKNISKNIKTGNKPNIALILRRVKKNKIKFIEPSTQKKSEPKTETEFINFTCLQHDDNMCSQIVSSRVGLTNPGNMCYANALYQAILYDLFTTFNYEEAFHNHTKRCSYIGCILIKTTKLYDSCTNPFNPSIFHNWVTDHVPMNRPHQAQEDVHELLTLIRSTLENSHRFPSSNRFQSIPEKFKGVIMNTISCKVCSTEISIQERFSDLSVQISSSIMESIKS